ncbi:MAG: hypothetical protein WBA10_02265 [Elainellaceae cyanobacterium]
MTAISKGAIALTLATIGLLFLGGRSLAQPTQVCEYNSDLGMPNPLGMRSYISITEEDGNISFLYEQFPSNVGNGDVPVTIASNRVLTFYETELAAARQMMRQNPEFYSELVGYPDPEGFASIDAVLICRPYSSR